MEVLAGRDEQGGCENMTLNTIKPNIRAWLHRKGFTEGKDIISLEKMGDSLMHALLILTLVTGSSCQYLEPKCICP